MSLLGRPCKRQEGNIAERVVKLRDLLWLGFERAPPPGIDTVRCGIMDTNPAGLAAKPRLRAVA